MIRQTNTIASNDAFLCGYLLGYEKAYGTGQPFLSFYADENGGQLAVMDGAATIVWHDEWEELQWFLSARADIHTIRCSPALAKRLALPAWETTVRPVMRCTASLSDSRETVTPSIRAVHPFLASVFIEMPPFEDWYVDVSHRVRHDCCRICAVENEGAVVASAMTVTEWDDGAVIGAVATHPDHRRRGYAARCVTELAAQLQQMGKTVYICPKNEGAQRLYERLGFVCCDETALLERI